MHSTSPDSTAVGDFADGDTSMTAFGIFSGLFNVGITLIAAALIWPRRRDDRRSRRFLWEALFIAAWSGFYVLWLHEGDAERAIWWLRCLSAAAICIPVAFFMLACAIVGRPGGMEARFYAGATLLLVPFSFTDYVVAGVSAQVGVMHWPVAGSGYWLYLIVFAGVALRANLLLLRHYDRAVGRERNQLSYVVLSGAVGFLGGATNFPAWYGLPIPPVGTPLVGLHMLGVCVAVIRFRLLPFNLGLARIIAEMAVPAGFVAVASVVYVGLAAMVGPQFEWVALGFTAYATMLLAYRWGSRLRRVLEGYLERRVAPQLLERRLALEALAKRLWLSPNEEEVFAELVTGLREVFRGGEIALYVRREGGDTWGLHAHSDRWVGDDASPGELPTLRADPALSRLDIVDPADAKRRIGVLFVRIPADSGGFLTEFDEQLAARLCLEVGRVVRTKRIERRAGDTEKMVSLGTLAAGIAHEFRNPLASIRVFVDLVGMRRGAQALALQEQVNQDVTRLNALISNVMALSQGARSGFQVVELNEVIAQAINSTVANYDALPAWFEVAQEGEGPARTHGSQPELVQVFTNLFSNAIDAARAVPGREPRIAVRVRVGAVVRVTVSDNGPGIPADELDRIWDAFHSTKAAEGPAGRRGGVGLGLAFVKVVLGLHNAEVRVRNPASGGAEFVIEMPLALVPAVTSRDPFGQATGNSSVTRDPTPGVEV